MCSMSHFGRLLLLPPSSVGSADSAGSADPADRERVRFEVRAVLKKVKP